MNGGPAPVDNMAIALAHAGRGRRVFPFMLTPTADGKFKKTPLAGGHGHLDATTDPDTIRGWWAAAPNAVPGWALDPGQVVLDIDDMAAFKTARCALPDAPLQQTPRGGWHLLYQTDGRPVSQTAGAIPGADTRVGGKGWVGLYSVDAFAGEPPFAPEWLYDVKPKRTYTPTEDGQPIPEHMRNDTLTRMAGQMREAGFDVETIKAAILGFNRDSGTYLPEDEIRRTIFRSLESWPIGSSVPLIRASEPSTTEPSDYIVNIKDYTAAVPTAVPWQCQPIAYSGGVTLIAGPAKGGKSTFAANLQRCRETGEKLLGIWDVTTGPTLLVTEEGGVAVVYKAGGLHALEVLDRRTALQGGLKFAGILELIGRWSETHAGGLVFIDTLAIWAGIEDENDAAKVTVALGAVIALAQRTGLAIILVHHTRKGGGEHGEAIRGSGAMLATVDIGLELTYTGDERYPDERYLTVQGRVILPERYRLNFDRLTKTYGMADLAARVDSETDADLAGVPADGPGLTRTDLHNLWGKDPRKLLETYLRAGRLRVESAKVPHGRELRYWKLPPRTLWSGDDD